MQMAAVSKIYFEFTHLWHNGFVAAMESSWVIFIHLSFCINETKYCSICTSGKVLLCISNCVAAKIGIEHELPAVQHFHPISIRWMLPARRYTRNNEYRICKLGGSKLKQTYCFVCRTSCSDPSDSLRRMLSLVYDKLAWYWSFAFRFEWFD